jgi:hypothetical protein
MPALATAVIVNLAAPKTERSPLNFLAAPLNNALLNNQLLNNTLLNNTLLNYPSCSIINCSTIKQFRRWRVRLTDVLLNNQLLNNPPAGPLSRQSGDGCESAFDGPVARYAAPSACGSTSTFTVRWWLPPPM